MLKIKIPNKSEQQNSDPFLIPIQSKQSRQGRSGRNDGASQAWRVSENFSDTYMVTSSWLDSGLTKLGRDMGPSAWA